MLQNQRINCIKCLINPADVQSHVVPNSIRKIMFGVKTKKGKKYAFTYIGSLKPHAQDFPKPNLMCRVCDSKFGSELEKTLPQLLMPTDIDNPKSWDELGLIPLNHGPFKDYPLAVQPLLKRNAALIAWKVLHAVARDGNTPDDLSSFLQTPAGEAINQAMLSFITQQDSQLPTISLKDPVLWKIEPKTATAITGKNDELPISWTVSYEEGQPETASIFAVFGLWIVGWQFPDTKLPLNVALAKWLVYLVERGKTSSLLTKC